MSAGLSPEFDALKTRLRATWTAGDFEQIAKSYTEGAEEFVRGLDLKPGMRVLDVACGTGNLALPAARMGADVTGIDIAANLIEQAREKAKREGLNVKFEEGDAENMPYADGSFDAVITMFGAMFTPRPEVTAAELKRVCRSGGFIAMANWTPAGFIGQMFKLVAKHVPPPNMPSPLLWGVQDNIRERLSEGVATLDVRSQSVTFRFPFGPAEVVETFLVYYGPTNKAFGALDEAKQAEIRGELEEQWAKANRATDGTTAVDSEYLRVLAVRG